MCFGGQNAGNKLQFHNPKSYSDLFTILNVIDAENPIVFFLGGGGGRQSVQIAY